MLFAKVALGLPIQESFDYAIPSSLKANLKKGMRILVPFRNERLLGYVVGISRLSKIKKVKQIFAIIDKEPILTESIFKLTKEVAAYYGCSWGEAIEAALPEVIRKTHSQLHLSPIHVGHNISKATDIILVHDRDRLSRWDIYLKEIESTLCNRKSVLFLNTDLNEAIKTEEILKSKFSCSLVFMHRRHNIRKLREDWLKIRNQQVDIVLGVRSAVFAPLENLGLIIVDEEQSQNYKNDQVPHYNSRHVSLMRARLDNSKVILASLSPSLEVMHEVRKKRINYIFLQKKDFYTQVQIINMRQQGYFYKAVNKILSPSLQAAIEQVLKEGQKVLLFANRKGFTTLAYCRSCNLIIRCPRCSINLAYHFKENMLICHYCNYKTEPPVICPQCNSSYIRYSGQGIEKIESELHRMYPGVKILKIDTLKDLKINEADVFVAGQAALKEKYLKFELVGVVSIDSNLNRIDFRAAEKTFSLLIGLLSLASKSLLIQTNIPYHYCFEALRKDNINLFYDKELALRRQLGFPPFRHFILIKIRGRNEPKVERKARSMFEQLSLINKDKTTTILNLNPAQPYKLRDNFYWQILIKSKNSKKTMRFVREYIQNIPHSGMIITVDVDPL